jgi:hypothetical protein
MGDHHSPQLQFYKLLPVLGIGACGDGSDRLRSGLRFAFRGFAWMKRDDWVQAGLGALEVAAGAALILLFIREI